MYERVRGRKTGKERERGEIRRERERERERERRGKEFAEFVILETLPETPLKARMYGDRLTAALSRFVGDPCRGRSCSAVQR